MSNPDTALYIRQFDGMDGSHWQVDAGPIDLAKVRKASAGSFFCWKATQSISMVDPTFHWARGESADLDFHSRLWYHWISSTQPVGKQVEHYLNTTGAFAVGEGVMLDGEEWDKEKEIAKPGVTHDRYAAWLEAVEEETHRPCSVYTGLYVAFGTIWKSERIRHSKYGPRPMHLAAYVSVENLIKRMTEQGVIDLPMDAWQYSSNGPVPGITGRCDMNSIIHQSVFNLACGHVNAPTPTPPAQEDDEMQVITNNDPRNGEAPQAIKYLLMDEGSLRHLTPLEWMLRGAPAGTPLGNAEIDAMPVWTPETSTPRSVTGSFTGVVS